MYFINLELLNEKYFKDRYDLQKFVEMKENVYDYLDSYFINKIEKLPVFGTTYVQIEENRPDLLSYRIYGTVKYWYILLIYNGMISPLELTEGQNINYPSINDLEEIYFSLNALQKKNTIQEGNR